MTTLRRTVLPWLATFVLVGLCLFPKGWLPRREEGPKLIPHLDKVVHFSLFAGFGACWLLAGPSLLPPRTRSVGVLVAALALAAGTEWLQGLPQIARDPDLFDALADAVGALASVGLVWGLSRGARTRVGASTFLILVGLTAQAATAGESKKFLIEFGWDEPDTTFLKTHLEAMERAPLDGCVFHAIAKTDQGATENLAWKAWGRRAFNERELAGAFADLRAIQPRRFTANLLRMNTTPADLDWFDDFSAVLANARLAARLVRAGRGLGILLDTEAYESPLFAYRKQREAATRSWDEYAAQARRRGEALMTAFQDEFPGLTVLLTFGPSLVARQTQDGKITIEDAPDGLLAPFVDDLARAARGETTVVDGHEPSYGYRTADQFDKALALIRKSGGPRVRAGFGLWLDYDWRANGWNASDPSKNYFTPEAFETSVREALERSDRIVWIYTETPRWWTEEGPSLKLPPAYLKAIRRARTTD